MYCKHCGREIADDSKFCRHCGGSQTIEDAPHNDVSKHDHGVGSTDHFLHMGQRNVVSLMQIM